MSVVAAALIDVVELGIFVVVASSSSVVVSVIISVGIVISCGEPELYIV